MPSIQGILVDKIMEFIIRDFMEEEVRVEVIGKSSRVVTHEGVIELVRGAEYNLPRWLAYMLAEKGIVNIKEEELSVEKLSNILYNEESTSNRPEFTKIPRYMYLLIKKKLSSIEDALKKKADLNLLQEYKYYEDLLYSINRTRVKKILYLLQLHEIPQDIIEKLSEEEKILLTILRETLTRWMNSLGIEKLF